MNRKGNPTALRLTIPPTHDEQLPSRRTRKRGGVEQWPAIGTVPAIDYLEHLAAVEEYLDAVDIAAMTALSEDCPRALRNACEHALRMNARIRQRLAVAVVEGSN